MPNSTKFDLNLIGSARAARKLQRRPAAAVYDPSFCTGSKSVIQPNRDTVEYKLTHNEERLMRNTKRDILQ